MGYKPLCRLIKLGKENHMEQVFIRVKKANGDWYHKNIMDATSKEKVDYYNTLSKGQIFGLLDEVLKKGK